MTRFWTSDLHLGLANIIRYCSRPFGDVDEMNRELVTRWNETVAEGDEVWVLGDVALGPIAEMFDLVGTLRGRKILVAGNHDRCWAGAGAKGEAWLDRYRDAGFSEVLQHSVPVELGPFDGLACHLPYEGDSHDDDRFVTHRPVDDGQLLLHGHVHERWRVRGRQVNVGVDVWDYRPVSDAELLAEIAAVGVS